MAHTTHKEIQERIRAAKDDARYKDYMYRFRRIFAGEYGRIGGTFAADLTETSLGDKRNNKSRQRRIYPDFDITSMTEGVDNLTFTVIRSLTMQVLIDTPDISFPDLSPDVSAFREQYLRDRLNKTSWVQEQELGIGDYLINGMAVFHVGLSEGIPTFIRIDPIDTFFDPSVAFPSQSRYAGILWDLDMDSAMEMLGPDLIRQVDPAFDVDKTERTIKVVEYWDADTRAFVHPTSGSVLKSEDNPYGFLPVVFFHGPKIPSIRHPVPHLLNMIPVQVAYSEAQKTINDTIKKNRPILVLTESAFTPDSLDAFQESDGDVNVLIRTETKDPGFSIIKQGEVSSEMLNILAMYKQQLTEMSQFNPFILGSSINPEFAREVDAIQNSANLFAGYVSKNLSIALSKVFRMMVRIGAQFDREILIIKQGDEKIIADEPNDLSRMLNKDVGCVVSASSYETEAVRSQRAIGMLQLISQIPELSTPALRKHLLGQTLESQNFKDIDTLMRVEDDDIKQEIIKSFTPQELEQIIRAGLEVMQQENRVQQGQQRQAERQAIQQ